MKTLERDGQIQGERERESGERGERDRGKMGPETPEIQIGS